MLNKYIKERIRGTNLFKWEPDVDLLVAFGTLFLTWLSYYGVVKVYRDNPILSVVIFIILTNVILNVTFPVWWVVIYKKRPISDLGITKRFLAMSIFISIALAAWRGASLPGLVQGIDWVPHLITSALIFWEPLFVFGWLQTRYEKCFGIIPAILLAASSFILYQIGSASMDGLVALLPVYILLAALFAVTKNIFTLWPIYWCIGSSVNSLSVGLHYGWDMTAVYALAFMIQLGYIFHSVNNKKPNHAKIS